MESPCHVVIDAFGLTPESVELLYDATALRGYISTITRWLHLTPVGEPTLQPFPTKDGSQKETYTATQVLSESSITIHCYPEHRAVYIDIFSCKEFDTGVFFNVTKRFFEAERVFLQRVKRASIAEGGVAAAPSPPLPLSSHHRD